MSKEGSAYTVIIEASSADELRVRVLNLAATYGTAKTTTEAAPAAAPSSEAPKSGKKAKKESPPAEETAAPATTSVDPFADDEDDAAAEEETEEKKYTFDEVKKVAQAFVEKQGDPKVGLPKLTELLGRFKDKSDAPVVKITALREKDYTAFVNAAK